MAFRTRVWSAGKLLLLVAALGATYAIFAAAAMRIAVRARDVQVPDLTDRTAAEASSLAAARGLAVRLDETRRPDPKIGAGRVLAQDPAPGSTSRQQRAIRVWLSAGPRAATVPSVTGETDRNAQVRLAQDGIEIASMSEMRSGAFAADVVVAQAPPAGTPGARVALLINRAEQADNYVMPDLIGVNGQRAAVVLREQGFRVAVVASAPYPGAGAGIVLRQNPQAGFQIAPGEPISLEVSR